MPVEPDDAALVRRSRAGDDRALNQLLARHQHRWYAICRRLTDSPSDALDATQDAMIAIVAGLDRYDGRAAFTTWAYRVTTNACLDQLRRNRRRPVVPLDETAPEPEGGEPSQAQQVADRLALEEGLAQLRPEFRAAVVLRDVTGLDYAEIAEVLGVPPGTVRSRIARGRRALADHLTATPPGNPQTATDVERTTS